MTELASRPRLSARTEGAFAYAVRIHATQTRKGTDTPYAAHLLGVAALVLENGARSEDEVIGAMLHDACEDQGGRARLQDIRHRFGDAVARIVDGCTDTYDDPKPPWRPRKEAYIARVRDHITDGDAEDILRVSLADKLHNARAIVADVREQGDTAFERFNGGKDGTLWYYQTLVDMFSSFPNRMAGELGRVVSDMDALADRSGHPAGSRGVRHS